MHKHRKLLVILGCLGAIAVTIAWLTRDDAPKYQGRSLSQWLRIYYEADRPNHDLKQRPAAAAAIRASGTDALPHLVQWLRYEPSIWDRKLVQALPRRTALRLTNTRLARATMYRGFHRAEAAQMAFQMLGTNAVPAVPALTSLMRNTSHPETAKRALEVLGYLGPEAFPALESGLVDTNMVYRELIPNLMVNHATRFMRTNACIPPLRSALQDQDPRVQVAARAVLAILTPTNSATAQE